MIESQKPKPQAEQVAAWLARQHEGTITDFAPLKGGFWSSAFSYRVGNDELVLRLSEMSEGFASDKAAMQFASAQIPVPDVIAVGEGLGLHYAISRRHYGRFLESIAPHEAEAAGAALATLLQAMRQAEPARSDRVNWYAGADAANLSWHDWLKGGLGGNGEPAPNSGWAKLAANPSLDALFKRCKSRIEGLLPACPERRDLIHGDLLYKNVLIAEDLSRVMAIFSWKCSALGDFLYDVAWCTLWGRWCPAIAQTNLWQRTLEAPDLSEDDLRDAPLRHHCYELQIAASHLGWFAWTGEEKELAKLAGVVEQLLERGPLTA